jgi:adenylate cyclase
MATQAAARIIATGPARPVAAEIATTGFIQVVDTIIGSGQPIADGDIVEWMLSRGRHLAHDGEFFDALCWRLLGAGLPISRVALSVSTLHPQILGFGFRWNRARRTTEIYRVGHGIQETSDYLDSPMRSVSETGVKARYRLDDAAALARFPLLRQLRDDGATDYLALPLTFLNGRHQIMTWTTDEEGGFTEAHLAQIYQFIPSFALVVENKAARRTTEALLATYLGRTARDHILDGEIRRGQGERISAVIMATDMRGFTALSDRLTSEELIALLDDYFDAVTAPVQARGGEVLKYVGDGVLAIFPLGFSSREEAAEIALAAARETLERIAESNLARAAEHRSQLRIGIGLHIGEVVLGNVGAADRLDFTVIGPAVNLACRLETLTKRLSRPLLVSEDFAKAAFCELVSLGFHPVKGMSEPAEVFGLPGGDGYDI